MLKFLIHLLLLLILLGSCSVERRLYRPGLSVHWFSTLKGQGSNVVKSEIEPLPSNQVIGIKITDPEIKEINNSSDFAVLASDHENIELIEEDRGSSYISLKNDISKHKSDPTAVNLKGDEKSFDEDPENDRTAKSTSWIYVSLFILLCAILGLVLWLGALYPFHVGVILIFPLSLLFGLDDRAGFLFGIFCGLSYVGLYFLTPMIGFWGIFFLGLLALLSTLLLATFLDDKMDQGERMDDYPPPPPPQMDPGEDW
jgi:hypothetical protein